MKSRLLASAVAVAVVGTGAILGVSAIAAPTSGAKADIAARADNFQLTDQHRMHYELAYYKYAPAIVIMTQANGSKASQAGAVELAKFAEAYKAKGVVTLMMNSKITDSREAVAAEMKKIGVDLPVMMDENQLVGESLGVSRDTEVFVIDPKTMKVAYHGPLDDRFSKASVNTKSAAKTRFAADAVDAILAGKDVAAPRIDVKGGEAIAFPERANQAAHAKISYAKDVAPIIEAKCVACHQEGGVAPFQLTNYDTIKGFSPMIRETVRTSRMPPYFADPHIGKFQNDQGLTADQKKTLVHWIEAGSPRGEGADPLASKKFVASPWPASLGTPDYVVDLPPFAVKASGIIEYQNQIVPNPFKEDKWLKAVAFKPGDRAVVHHMVSNHMPDPALKGGSGIPGGSLGSYTPGAEAQRMAAGSGAPIPAGGRMYFQMHYTASGKEVVDKSQVGFYFHDKTPEFIKRSVVIRDSALTIPAGEARHTTYGSLEFPADAEIYTLYPHAHLRGVSVELTAVYPDGKKETLLSLPKYDFNWQRDYDPIEPIKIKAGTKLMAKWVYDNSEHNKANPDPKINVTWGEQTHQEMMYFRVNYRFMDETSKNIRNDLQQKLNQAGMIGGLDDNLDGLIQIEELQGTMAPMKARFAQLDKDGNGGLSRAEMTGQGFERRRDLEDDGL